MEMSSKVNPKAGVPTAIAYEAPDRFGQAVIIQQEFAPLELCAIEAKNRYRVTKSSKDPADKSPNGQAVFYINEESDCMERVCCSVNRSLSLLIHQGSGVSDPVVLRMRKPFHLQGCICCCRPALEVANNQGDLLGRVEDPFTCETCLSCGIDQRIYDEEGTHIYTTWGSLCQPGFCCPCLCPVQFHITNVNGGDDGHITKLFDGCGELMGLTNRFKLTFPPDAPEAHKSLLLGAAMLLDLEYFEKNKNSNN